MSEKRTIYLDCTATLYSGTATGIQRVVRNIVQRKSLMEQEFNIQVTLIASILGKFYEVAPGVILNPKPATAALGTRIRTKFDFIKQKIETHTPWPKFCLPVVSKSLAALEWVLKKLFWVFKYARAYQTILRSQQSPIKVAEGDMVVLLDAFWQFDLSGSLKRSNAKVIVTVMYDLVPVYYGQFVESVNRNLFLNALPWVLKASTRFLCISADVEEQLKKYCASRNVHGKGFDHFVLGSDFSPNRKAEGLVRLEWDAIFEGEDVWLMVGTIEPRKNHQMALDAFDQLWAEGGRERLLIIGRLGWECEKLMDRIVTHPQYNKRLFFIGDANDAELQAAYKKSEGLIFSSFAEGFGLPLVEAMSMKIKVICSEIAIFREVGGDYPVYFKLDSPRHLIEALNIAKTRTPPQAIPWVTWDESARDFTKKLLLPNSH